MILSATPNAFKGVTGQTVTLSIWVDPQESSGVASADLKIVGGPTAAHLNDSAWTVTPNYWAGDVPMYSRHATFTATAHKKIVVATITFKLTAVPGGGRRLLLQSVRNPHAQRVWGLRR
jgi:hypothetical protein